MGASPGSAVPVEGGVAVASGVGVGAGGGVVGAATGVVAAGGGTGAGGCGRMMNAMATAAMAATAMPPPMNKPFLLLAGGAP